MTLQTKSITDLTEADVRGLVDNAVPESKWIEYKRDLPGRSDADKKEFLFDVSSFANASGGHLIYGIEEQGGIPTQICGLAVPDPDAELLRLQGMMLDGIAPRIPGLDARFIPIANSLYVFVIHAPKSWNPPHMVTLQGVNKFYSRNSAGKHLLDVDELRGLFMISDSVTDRVRKFRTERLSRILADETPIGIAASPRIVVHLIPLHAWSSTARINLQLASTLFLFPLGASGYGTRFNLDGLMYFANAVGGRAGHSAYLQLYHNGIIETVDTTILSANLPQKIIASTYLENKVIEHVQRDMLALQKLQVNLPVVAMLTLIGVKGHYMATSLRFMHGGGGAPIDRDIVAVPEVILDTFECAPRELKPMFDSVWNAAGWPQSLNFDTEGNHVPE